LIGWEVGRAMRLTISDISDMRDTRNPVDGLQQFCIS
jgi:hypothetical protein